MDNKMKDTTKKDNILNKDLGEKRESLERKASYPLGDNYKDKKPEENKESKQTLDKPTKEFGDLNQNMHNNIRANSSYNNLRENNLKGGTLNRANDLKPGEFKSDNTDNFNTLYEAPHKYQDYLNNAKNKNQQSPGSSAFASNSEEPAHYQTDHIEDASFNHEEQQQLEKDLEEAQEKLKESEGKYLRSLADIENLRKRSDKSQIDAAKYAIAELAKELVGTLDIFNKAFAELNLDSEKNSLAGHSPAIKNFITGIQLTQKELNKALSKFGITKVEALDKRFDANFHEALFSKTDTNKEDDTIYEVVEEGYKIHDRILRSAKVGVIKNT
ncbi:putative nucleotide exchange factor GrpE [Candidatus Hepatincolaceae symbiont of Richtersius coronifer]